MDCRSYCYFDWGFYKSSFFMIDSKAVVRGKTFEKEIIHCHNNFTFNRFVITNTIAYEGWRNCQKNGYG